tara:strand:+ start:805 stop:1230 length:426 start_codon:yes stop_codon:yes gene_type:complete
LTKQELNIVFDQAKKHHATVTIHRNGYEVCVYRGVQIIKEEDGTVKIYKAQGMDYYNELTHDYDLFKDGWRAGVYLYLKKKYNKDLDFLSKKIRDLMNTSSTYKKKTNTLKEIEACKFKRKNIVIKYSRVSQKLNTLNHLK